MKSDKNIVKDNLAAQVICAGVSSIASGCAGIVVTDILLEMMPDTFDSTTQKVVYAIGIPAISLTAKSAVKKAIKKDCTRRAAAVIDLADMMNEFDDSLKAAKK